MMHLGWQDCEEQILNEVQHAHCCSLLLNVLTLLPACCSLLCAHNAHYCSHHCALTTYCAHCALNTYGSHPAVMTLILPSPTQYLYLSMTLAVAVSVSTVSCGATFGMDHLLFSLTHTLTHSHTHYHLHLLLWWDQRNSRPQDLFSCSLSDSLSPSLTLGWLHWLITHLATICSQMNAHRIN